MGNANVFRGRIEGMALRIGEDRLPHGNSSPPEPFDVVAYARPQDLSVVPEGHGPDGVKVRVSRILESGSMARIELVREASETGTLEYYEVEMTHDALNGADLAPGQIVRLHAKRLRLFDLKGAHHHELSAAEDHS
jgi:sulfate transport system ATP-binding protein